MKDFICFQKTSLPDNCKTLTGRMVLVSIISVLIFFGQGVFNTSRGQGKEVVLMLKSGPDNPRNSEGDFITLKDDRILFVYTRYTGNSDEDSGSAFLAGRYSDDQGKTWSKTEKKILENNEGIMNIMSVSLLRLKNGKIALFYLRKNTKDTDCIPYIRISDDEAESWSDPTPCITDKKSYNCLHNNRVIQLKNGRLLFAVGTDTQFYHDRVWSYYSDDNGQSWSPGAEVPNPENVINQEPAVVELKNGDIYMLIRTGTGVQYESFSKDRGETWSPCKPSSIKSPEGPASIARIPTTGDLLLVWNNTTGHRRTPMNVAVSKDEGKSWIKVKSIEDDPNGRYCYTAIHFTEKNVLFGYSAGDGEDRKPWGGLNITRASIEWIYK